MPAGKLSAQTGHAYGDLLDLATEIAPERKERYRNRDTGGSKVTLKAKNQNQLINAYNAAMSAGIPAVVVVDQEHVMLPHFNGEPIITAIGIGPCTKSEVRHITKKFNCV
jgi:peptidyl-tRNA hydrolase